MQLLFSDAKSVQAYKPSLPVAQSNVDVDHLTPTDADPSSIPELDQAESLAVVQQTIDALEAQGLLMLFDRPDRVAKRLTDDLITAGVLPAGLRSQPDQRFDSP